MSSEGDVVADATNRLTDAGWIGRVRLRCCFPRLGACARVVAAEIDGHRAGYEDIDLGVDGGGGERLRLRLRLLRGYMKSICTI